MEAETAGLRLTLEAVRPLLNNLFLSERLSFKVKPSCVKFSSLAYENSIVLILGGNKLVHMNKHNEVLWSLQLSATVKEFRMRTDRDGVIKVATVRFSRRKNQIISNVKRLLFSLSEKTVKQVTTDSHQIVVFPDPTYAPFQTSYEVYIRQRSVDFSYFKQRTCFFSDTLILIIAKRYDSSSVLMVVDRKSRQVLSLIERPRGDFAYEIPRWSKDTLCIEDLNRLNQSNVDSLELELICFAIPPIKDVYMQWLLHINEDFDDDLLQDTIDLLTPDD